MTNSQPTMMTLNSLYPREKPCRAASSSSFHSFATLPAELRVRVWKLSLEQQTPLITVSLSDVKKKRKRKRNDTDASDPKSQPLYSGRNHLGNPVSGSAYRVTLQNRPFFSPLLWSCSESRQIALSYYRVRIPMVPSDGPASPQLYLNPDHDYLYIRSLTYGLLLAHFLCDLRSYDTSGTGIRHLALYSQVATGKLESIVAPALGENDHTSSSSSSSLSSASTTAVTYFRETLRNLRTLWFVHLTTDHARIMGGPLSGLPGNYQLGLNCSVPVFPRASRFTILGPDPRPIEQDMKKLPVFSDPRMAALAWEDMEERFGVGYKVVRTGGMGAKPGATPLPLVTTSPPRRIISYAVAVCAVDTDDYNHEMTAEVRGPKTFNRYLAKEKEIWEDYEEKFSGFRGKMTVSQVPSAAGFWLFPADSFDSLPLDQGKKISFDMAGRPRPTLGLFTL